jgi:hypothetical protein
MCVQAYNHMGDADFDAPLTTATASTTTTAATTATGTGKCSISILHACTYTVMSLQNRIASCSRHYYFANVSVTKLQEYVLTSNVSTQCLMYSSTAITLETA